MLYAYYGDDYTGSTDVLESLSLAGIKTALFLAPPTPEQLAEFPSLQAIGIAGDSRSRSPHWMSDHLPRTFQALKAFGAPVTHYKACSTFDSAPHVGSIGRAIELGIEAFNAKFVPIIVGAPHLGRYVVFGNLFASAGEVTYRIDRHPTMSRHPVTPMHESDLRQHLALQTALPIGLVDLRDLTPAALEAAQRDGAAAVIFDSFDTASLKAVGALLWDAAVLEPLFAVGSSGLTQSLITSWQHHGIPPMAAEPKAAVSVDQIAVFSGSCSPVTQAQIAWGINHGFDDIALDAVELIANPLGPLNCVLRCLRAGRSPILYTSMGPLEASQNPYTEQLGVAIGKLLHAVLEQSDVRRVVLCGGDTSSHAMQQLPIRALTYAAPMTPGAPVCTAHAAGTKFHGLQLVLKGGQVGPVDFFGVAKG